MSNVSDPGDGAPGPHEPRLPRSLRLRWRGGLAALRKRNARSGDSGPHHAQTRRSGRGGEAHDFISWSTHSPYERVFAGFGKRFAHHGRNPLPAKTIQPHDTRPRGAGNPRRGEESKGIELKQAIRQATQPFTIRPEADKGHIFPFDLVLFYR